jgi:hypothetical protein
MHFTPSKHEALAATRGIEVSRDGKDVTRLDGMLIAQRASASGYQVFTFGTKKARKKCQTHRLQAWQKFGEKMYEGGIVCRHLDGDSQNNHWDNIAIGTQSENMLDRPEAARKAHGFATSRHVLKHDHEAINAFYLSHGFKATLAAFGLSSRGTLSYILNKSKTTVPVSTQHALRTPRCA